VSAEDIERLKGNSMSGIEQLHDRNRKLLEEIANLKTAESGPGRGRRDYAPLHGHRRGSCHSSGGRVVSPV